MKINLIFRNRKAGFSINQVFDNILNNLPSDITTNKIEAPYSGASFKAILLNLLFFIKYRKDYNHITGDISYVALVLKKRNTIITFHDIIGIKNSRGIKRLLIFIFWYYLPIIRSQFITVISEKTKNDILANVKKNIEKKIIVINNPYNPIFMPVTKKFNKNRPIILQIGTKKNKNLERLIIALSDISIELRIIGQLNKMQIELLEKYKITYSTASNLTEEQIFNEYCNSDIISFVSTFEGFGMPIIEGQAIGRPVVTSNLSPMKEIAGKSCILVNPKDPISIKNGFIQLIQNDQLRNSIIESGFNNIKRFNPQNISKQYQKLYHSVFQ